MSELVGNPEDRFARDAAHFNWLFTDWSGHLAQPLARLSANQGVAGSIRARRL